MTLAKSSLSIARGYLALVDDARACSRTIEAEHARTVAGVLAATGVDAPARAAAGAAALDRPAQPLRRPDERRAGGAAPPLPRRATRRRSCRCSARSRASRPRCATPARRALRERARVEARGVRRLVGVRSPRRAAACARRRRGRARASRCAYASNSNGTRRPSGCVIASALEVDRQLVARRDRRLAARRARSGRATIGASPVLIAFVRKMSPNDGASTTRKP